MKFYYLYLVSNRRLTYKGNPFFGVIANQKRYGVLKKRSSYKYDALNRITSAVDNTGNYNLTNIAYDKNGNIGSLERQGHTELDGNGQVTDFGVMDDLTYSYLPNSNKLMKVADAAIIDQYGFKDDAVGTAADTTDDYSYDSNGNLLTDTNKGITSILYNHLNMPTKITVTGGNAGVLDYVYTADGIKLRKIKTQGGVPTTTDYAGDYVYENGDLKQFFHPEGYIEPNGSSYQYVYQYKDHQNNVRLTYADTDGNGTISQGEIRREQNYYPFGLEHQGYNNNIVGTESNYKQYQSQEFTEDLGLNTHEWKYRMSDPAIGRFWQVDPLAEDYVYNGVYNFSENRVVDGVELEGLEFTDFRVDQKAKKVARGEQTTVTEVAMGAGLAVFGVASVATLVLGPKAVLTFVANEIKDEAASRLTNGASDVLDATKMATKAVKEGAEILTKKSLHKNANDAEGNFVLYEVEENKEILKVGKANADDIMPTTGDIRRVHTSERKARQAGYPKAKAKVVKNLGNTTTKKAKKAEASRVRNYRENGQELPLNKERSKQYQPNN